MSFRTRYEEKTCTLAEHADKQGAEVFSLSLEMTKGDWALMDKLHPLPYILVKLKSPVRV